MEILNRFIESNLFNNIITGLFSSGLFLLILALLKPRVVICDKIAHSYDESQPLETQNSYLFKIINKSLFFRIYDIQVRVWNTEIIPSKNAENFHFKTIPLVKDFQWVINRLYVGHLFQNLILGEKRLEKRTDYAAQFLTYTDIHHLINKKNFITIEVIAKHSLTGFTRVIKKTYKHKNDIVKGEFFSGNSCKVK